MRRGPTVAGLRSPKRRLLKTSAWPQGSETTGVPSGTRPQASRWGDPERITLCPRLLRGGPCSQPSGRPSSTTTTTTAAATTCLSQRSWRERDVTRHFPPPFGSRFAHLPQPPPDCGWRESRSSETRWLRASALAPLRRRCQQRAAACERVREYYGMAGSGVVRQAGWGWGGGVGVELCALGGGGRGSGRPMYIME